MGCILATNSTPLVTGRLISHRITFGLREVKTFTASSALPHASRHCKPGVWLMMNARPWRVSSASSRIPTVIGSCGCINEKYRERMDEVSTMKCVRLFFSGDGRMQGVLPEGNREAHGC